MLKFLLVSLSVLLVLTGCQSNKLAQAKGEWVDVNQVGFIPPNVIKYRDSYETVDTSELQRLEELED